MEVVLHVGAHRTGAGTLQAALRQNTQILREAGIVYWGPRRTREGLFKGLSASGATHQKSQQRRAESRVQYRLSRARNWGRKAILVSDENLLGDFNTLLIDNELYPDVGVHLAPFAKAFAGQVTRVALSIRAQDQFWASVFAHAVAQGRAVPGPRQIRQLVASRRSWRHVITDLHHVFPKAEISVLPYESHRADPQSFLRYNAKLEANLRSTEHWKNKSLELPDLRRILSERDENPDQLPDVTGRWHPFDEQQSAELQEMWADDLFWLAAGADGIATLTDMEMARERGKARCAATTRGQIYDQEGYLDKTG